MSEENFYYALNLDTDSLLRDAKKAKQEINAIGGTIDKQGDHINQQFKSIGKTLTKTIGAAGIGIGIEEIARSMVNFSQQFNKSMLEVATISSTVTEKIDNFKQQILNLTTEIPIQADEAAKALYQIVSAGHDGAAGMDILEVASKAAIGGVTETATAADAITTLLNGYKKGSEEAEKMSDQLFTTVRLGKTTFGELGHNIAQAAPIAAQFGIETEQMMAAIATLTQSGVPTAQAMTQIRAAILASSKVLGDGYYNTHTFQEGLAEIAAMSGGSQAKLRELVPEIEALNGVLGLTGINADMASAHLAEMQKTTGATESAFKKMSESSEAQITLLTNTLKAKFADAAGSVEQLAGSIAGALNEALESDDLETYTTILGGLVAMVGAYKTAVLAANVHTKIKNALLAQSALQSRLAAAQGIVLSQAEAMQAAKTQYLSAAKQGLAKSIKSVTKAMLANPYALAAAAVAALGVVLYKAITAQNEWDLANERLVETTSKIDGAINKEMRSLAELEEQLATTEKGSKEWQSAKDTIVSKYGVYIKGLDDEIERVGTLAGKYDDLQEAIRQAKAEENYTAFKKSEEDNAEKVKDESLAFIYDKVNEEYGAEKAAEIMKEVRAVIYGTQKEISKETLKLLSETNGIFTTWENSAQGHYNRAKNANKVADKNVKNYEDTYGIDPEEIAKRNKENADAAAAEKKTAEELAAIEAEKEAAAKAYNELLKQRKKELEEINNIIASLAENNSDMSFALEIDNLERQAELTDNVNKKLEIQDEIRRRNLEHTLQGIEEEKQAQIDKIDASSLSKEEKTEKKEIIEREYQKQEDIIINKSDAEAEHTAELNEKEQQQKRLKEYQEYYEKRIEIKQWEADRIDEINQQIKDKEISEEEGAERITATKASAEIDIEAAAEENNIPEEDETTGVYAQAEDIIRRGAEYIATQIDVIKESIQATDDPKLKAKYTAKLKTLEKELKNIATGADDDADKTGDAIEKKYAGVHKVMSGVNGVIDEVQDAFGDLLGEAANDAIDTAQTVATTSIALAEGISKAAQMGAQGIKSVEGASVILLIIQLAIQIAMKLVEVFTKYFSANAKLQAEIDKSKERVDALNQSYEESERIQEKMYGAKWAVEQTKQLSNLKNQQADYNKQLALANEQMDKAWSKKQRDKAQENIDAAKEGLNETADEIASLLEETIEHIGATDLKSFSQDMAESLVEGWEDGLSGMNKAFDETLDNLIKQMLTARLAEQLMSVFDNSFNKLNESLQDNKLTEEEMEIFLADLDRAKGEASTLSKAMKKIYDSLGIDLGIDQSAQSKGFEAMTQDTADELNGRFTALQMHGANIEALVLNQTDLAQEAAAVRADIRDSMLDMTEIASLQLQELQQINANTALISETNNLLRSVKTNTSKL